METDNIDVAKEQLYADFFENLVSRIFLLGRQADLVRHVMGLFLGHILIPAKLKPYTTREVHRNS